MMNCLFEIGLNNAIAVTLLALVVFSMTRIWRNEHVAHVLWILVLIKFVFPPIFQTPIGLPDRLLGGSFVVAERTDYLAANQSEMEEAQNDHSTESARDVANGQDNAKSRVMNASTTQPVVSGGRFQIPSAKSVIFAAWLVGSALCLLRMVVHARRFGRLVRAATTAPAGIRELATAQAEKLGLHRCPDIRLIDADLSPGIWSAWCRPVVLLPTTLVQSLSPGELSAILGHEIAHIRRRDHWLRWIEVFVVSLYWWHPVAWWTRRELRQTAEICCDACVLTTNCGNSETYSLALLATVELVVGSCRTAPELALPFGQITFLKRRLAMILEDKHTAGLTWRYWLAFAVLALGVLPLSAVVVDAAGNGNEIAPPVAADVSADDVLEAARKASVAANEALQSVHSSGTFTVHRRNLTAQDETLWTDGSFELFYDRGKYRLDITFRKRLINGRHTDANGQTTEEIVDLGADRAVIICDGQTASVVSFSSRINPTGCHVDRFGSMSAAVVHVGFPLRSPAKPGLKVLNVDALIKNLGADAITFSQLDAGIARGTYNIKNSKNCYVEFDVDPRKGNNVISKHVFNRPSTEPAASFLLTWERMDSVWFVKRFEDFHRYDFSEKPPFRERTVVTFDSFAPNKPIDKKVFAIQSLPIPPGTRTLDHTQQKAILLPAEVTAK